MHAALCITGFMGAGKTTVARVLAGELARPFIDLDRFIHTHTHRTPQQIIDTDGEAMFRRIETENLRRVLDETGLPVVALGGGAWTIEANRALIAERGAVSVWLDASFDLCWERIHRTARTRPFARDRAAAEKLFMNRQPLYRLAALHVPVTENDDAAHIARRIITAL